ncbi:MAG: RHS repeat-associated core domain-containing protein [Solirubrobacterales bacterium]
MRFLTSKKWIAIIIAIAMFAGSLVPVGSLSAQTGQPLTIEQGSAETAGVGADVYASAAVQETAASGLRTPIETATPPVQADTGTQPAVDTPEQPAVETVKGPSTAETVYGQEEDPPTQSVAKSVYETEELAADSKLNKDNQNVEDSVYDQVYAKPKTIAMSTPKRVGSTSLLATEVAASTPLNFESIHRISNQMNGIVGPRSVNQSDKTDLGDRYRSSESIDPQSGHLTLTQTDLSLPGKDGLNLDITRCYRSDDASIGNRQTKFDENATYFYKGAETTGPPPVHLWLKKLDGTYENLGFWRNDQYIAVGKRVAAAYPELYENNIYTSADQLADGGIYYYVRNYTNEENFLNDKYGLGTGWSFSFPYIQMISVTDANSSDHYDYVLHDGAGRSYEVDFNIPETHLRNCPQKTASFNNAAPGNKYSAAFSFVDEAKRTYYFSSTGNLLAIADRLGNDILFEYNGLRITKITDSVRRVINFYYADNADTSGEVRIVVSYPNNPRTIELRYTRAAREVFIENENLYWQNDTNDRNARNKPVLQQVLDPEGKTTRFGYQTTYAGFTYLYDANTGTDQFSFKTWGTQPYFCLNSVDYPRSVTHYDYSIIDGRLGQTGYLVADPRVQRRWDQQKTAGGGQDSRTVNDLAYVYEGNYLNARFDGQQYKCTVKDQNRNTSLEYEFNENCQVFQTLFTDNGDLRKAVSHTEYDARFPAKPTKTTILDANNYSVVERQEDHTYNEWGGILTTTEYDNTGQTRTTTVAYDTTNPDNKYLVNYKKVEMTGQTPSEEWWKYDGFGRIIEYTNPKLEKTTYAYSGSNNETTTVTRALENNKSAVSVSTCGPETGYAFPTESKSRFTDKTGTLKWITVNKTYDMLLGTVKTASDGSGKQTIYDTDILGRVVRVQNQDSAGQITDATVTYTNNVGMSDSWVISGNQNLLTTVVQETAFENGVKHAETKSYYNAFGQMLAEQNRNCANGDWIVTRQYLYDGAMRPAAFSDAAGYQETYQYDGSDNPTRITDPLGNSFITEYKVGSRTTESYVQVAGSSERLNPVSVVYDQFGRETSTTNLARHEGYEYDLHGNVTSYVDPNLNLFRFSYDSLGQLTQVNDPEGNKTDYHYTILGALDTVTQYDGGVPYTTNYYYDELGHLLHKQEPSESSQLVDTYYEYDNYGKVVKTTDPNGTQILSAYDRLDRLNGISATTTDGVSDSITYVNGPYGVVSLTGTGGTTSNQYDGLGRLKQSTTTYNGKTLGYQITGFDILNRMLSIQDCSASPFAAHYFYDQTRVDKVQVNGSLTRDANAPAVKYEYYPDGKLKTVTYPQLSNGTYLKTDYTYDEYDQVTSQVNSIDGKPISQYDYTVYDNNGNLKDMAESSGSIHYEYDKLDRLKTVKRLDEKTSNYSFDGRGNRKQWTGDLIKPEEANADLAFTPWNQLKSYTSGTQTTTFDYAPTGFRIRKTGPDGQETYYSYDHAGKLIGEYDAGNQRKAGYIWGPDRLLARIDANGIYYYLYNGHGDVVQIVDTDGTIVNEYQYDEYGNTIYAIEEIENPFRYTGEVFDKETGLYYLKARYYQPVNGRFIGKDSFEGDTPNPLSLNQYGYCEGNPVEFGDPSGHYLETAADVVSWGMSAHDMYVEPSLVNGLFLAWDTVAVIGGGVPGSWVVRGGKKIWKAAGKRALKAAKKGKKAAKKAVKKVAKAKKPAKAKAAPRNSSPRSATVAKQASNQGEDMVKVYRGTANMLEQGIYEETGELMSDAARQAYMETGSVSEAYAAAEATHQEWVGIWGDQATYVEAHGAFGTELPQAFGLQRTMISVTTSENIAKVFAGPNGRVFEANVPASNIIPQTLDGAAESEFLMLFGAGGFN